MAFASYKQIADAIAARIQSVANAGQVHKYIRLITDKEKFEELFLDPATDRIAGWMFSRIGPVDETLESTNQETESHSTFVLYGYLGLADETASELVFQQIVDDVRETFRPVGSFNDAVELVFLLQVRSITHAELHGHLCHRAECTLEVQEFYTP